MGKINSGELQEFSEAPPKINAISHFFKIFFSRKIVIAGLVIIVLCSIAAIFAQWLAPYDPYEINPANSLASPSSEHWLGTDTLGRDYMSRMIYGARTSMLIGICSVLIAAGIGIILGLVAGYFGGFVNAVIMRFIDAFMAFPMIMLMLIMSAVMGAGIFNLILALGISMMASYARIICGQVISIKENDYVIAARLIGCSNTRIMFQHVLPNCLAPVIVMMTMMIGAAILAEAGLSFLGMGINQPTATWGGMVNNGYSYLLDAPHLSLIPGLAIMLLVFAFNMVGDGLRDALDPRLRGTL
jgi:ABC-type dipeptide/oligopeptide/nickel transport system permease subunit